MKKIDPIQSNIFSAIGLHGIPLAAPRSQTAMPGDSRGSGRLLDLVRIVSGKTAERTVNVRTSDCAAAAINRRLCRVI